MTTTRISSPHSPAFAESAIADSGATVYLSGAVGFDERHAGVVAGGIAAEARATFDYLEQALARAGASLSDVVKLTAYLTDLADYPAYSAERARRFAHHPPASTAVQVSGLLLGARLEVEAVAVIS